MLVNSKENSLLRIRPAERYRQSALSAACPKRERESDHVLCSYLTSREEHVPSGVRQQHLTSIRPTSEESMTADPAFWADMKNRFKDLDDPTGDLHATNSSPGRWIMTGGPRDDTRSLRLQGQFSLLVLRAAIVSRIPTRVRALDWWLNMLTKGQNPPFIRHLVNRSN